MDQGKPISHVVAGLLIASFVVLISLVSMFTNRSGPQSGWISYLVIIFGVIFFIQRYAKANDYAPTFGQLFSYGFKASTIVTLLFILFLIGVSLFYPQWKQNFIEATRLEMERQKGVKETDIEMALRNIEKYYWIFVVGSVLFFFVFIGAIGSLIGAAVTKKRPSQSPQTPF